VIRRYGFCAILSSGNTIKLGLGILGWLTFAAQLFGCRRLPDFLAKGQKVVVWI
jgi:hypothetical protein